MTTSERELTEPVDLCTPDGAPPQSRRPGLVAPSVAPRQPRSGATASNKRWDYWAVLAGDLVVSSVYSDIDHFGLADVWWADLATQETGGRAILVPAGGGIALPEVPGTAPLTVDRDGLDLRITDDDAGTRLRATWTEDDGRPGRLDVTVALPPGHESLNVVIPWSDDLFNFTSKHQARPAAGELVVGDRRWAIGARRTDAWGVLDVGRGRWPARHHLELGRRCRPLRRPRRRSPVRRQVDGRHRLHRERPHRRRPPDQARQRARLGLRLGRPDAAVARRRPGRPARRDARRPRFDKHSKVDASVDLGSETHQVFGTWSGRLVTDDGLAVDVQGLQGFAEEARQRW